MAIGKDITKKIIDAVGGQNNVRTLGHCMTRLRFTLKDSSKIDEAALKSIKDVKGLSKPGQGQLHVIIGTGLVDEYCDAILAEYKFGESDYSDLVEKEDLDQGPKTPVQIVTGLLSEGMAVLAACIAPWLGCIMGSLMITAILSLLTSLNLVSSDNSTYLFFSTISGACIYSLPILIGFSAGDRLGTNKYMGALLGAIMIYPSMMSAVEEGTVSFFGISIKNFSYTSTIIPVILAVWLLKYVEKLAKKICPNIVALFGVTLIELVICVPLTYLIVGPVGSMITSGIASLVMFIYNHAGILAPAVAGAIMPIAVMCGVHLGLFPIAALMITDVGCDPIIHPALMCYNMAIAGACLAYGVKAKNADNKSLGLSAGLSGILGITEGGLFGVVLSNKRVLITTEIGILLTGIVCGITGYVTYVPMSQSIFAVPAAAHGDFNLAACAITLVAGVVITFVVTYLFGGSSEAMDEAVPKALEVADDAVVAPADGELIDVTTVSDETFSQKMLGESVAFKYNQDKVILCAPANGKLSVLFPTGHAFGVTTKDGVEILVHCGINTVEANGDGFTLMGKIQGDEVKAGEPVVEVDLKKLSRKFDMSTIMIITEDNGKTFNFTEPGAVKRGQSILK